MSGIFDHRYARRVHLTNPPPVQIATSRGLLVDVSVTGVGLSHEAPLRPGTTHDLQFTLGGRIFRLTCTVMNTRRGSVGLLSFRSGLAVEPASTDARTLAEYRRRVALALERLLAREATLPPPLPPLEM